MNTTTASSAAPGQLVGQDLTSASLSLCHLSAPCLRGQVFFLRWIRRQRRLSQRCSKLLGWKKQHHLNQGGGQKALLVSQRKPDSQACEHDSVWPC